VRFLLQLWGKVTERARTSRAPAVLYQDLGLIRRVVRDLFTGEVDRFVVDSPGEYDRLRDLVGSFALGLKERIHLHRGSESIFEAHGVEREIERALHRKVWLRSGGYVVFDRTEAATVIDVNTGKYVGKTDLASTILKTNLEAVQEIVRQIRLRDIGGIILIDFIDMDVEKHQRRVLAALQEAVRADRTKIHVIDLTGLGLVEITRKRVYQDLEELMRIPCPYCEGRGRVLSPQSTAVRVRRELQKVAATSRARCIIAEVHPEVAAILDEDSAWRESLVRASGKTILVRAQPGVYLDRMSVVQADSVEDAAGLAGARANGDGGQTFWLDPVRGEVLDLPNDEARDVPLPSGAPRSSAAGAFRRVWAWINAHVLSHLIAQSRPIAGSVSPAASAAAAEPMGPPGPPSKRGRGRRRQWSRAR
jgi:ribonuclease G